MSPRPGEEGPTGRLGPSKACKSEPRGERSGRGVVLGEGCDCGRRKSPSCSRMRLFAGVKMERTRDGDLERLEPARVSGRFTSSKTGCEKRSRGRSTRTGRGILAHTRCRANWPTVAQDAICHNVSRHLHVTPTGYCADTDTSPLSSSSTGITTSNTPVPHRIGRPNTKFPDGV
jgi:hypothetical protein